MEIVRENISKLNDILSITLGVNDYSEKVEKALRNTAKKVDIKGFRKGMVPAGVVKKMYGNSVLAEEVNTILNDAIHNYIEENKLDILGQPLPVEDQKVTLEINTPIDYTFKYEIGLQPSFTLSHIESKPSYDQEEIVIDDKLLNDEVEHMQKRHGSNESPDDIAENDIIYVELVEVNADGSTKEGGVMNSTSFNVDILKAGDDKNKIMGLKKGDSVVLNIFEAFERERESVLKHILNVKEEEAANLGDTFKVTLSNVNRLVNASLDQAFFDKVYGPGIINSEDEMRARITEELKAYFAKQTEVKVLQELAKDLIDKTEMDMPSDFLKRWIKVSNEKEITDEQLEKDFPAFEKELKWSLIVGKVAKEQEFKVELEEIKQRTREIVQNQLIQYGMGAMPNEQLDNFGKRYMDDQRHVQKTHESLLEEKVLNHLKQFIVINEKPISLEEYSKRAQAEHAHHDHEGHDHEH